MRSRHGVFYMRVVIPIGLRRLLGLKRREVKLSLKTVDAAKAQVLYCKKFVLMQKILQKDYSWEEEAENRQKTFERGLRLVRQFGLDPHDEFERDALEECCQSDQDLQAYVFAFDAVEEGARRRAARRAPPAVGARGASQPPLILPEAEPKDDLPLDAAIGRFVDAKKATGIRSATADGYGDQLRTFALITSEKRLELRISELTTEHMRQFAENLPRLPQRTRCRDPRSLAQILADPRPPISATTKRSYAIAVDMFLRWCDDQHYAIRPGLTSILNGVRKKNKNAKIGVRDQHGLTELKLMFESKEYRQGTFRLPSEYWLPLLATFTGARQGELCQLAVDDVLKGNEGGFWTISIHKGGDNLVKNNNAVRTIPVHPKLIELGFADYAMEQKAKGETRIFPEEKRNARGEFDRYSKSFNRQRKKWGINSTGEIKKDFHSFRHSIKTVLRNKVDSSIADLIAGHSDGDPNKVYFHGYDLDVLYDAVSKIQFDVDFDGIKRRGWRQRYD